MDEDTSKTTKTVWFWAIGLNVIAWGGYLVLTRVMESPLIRFARA